VIPYRPGVAQRVGRGIALLFHDRSTRRGWVVSSTPRPHFTPGKDSVPILQEAWWSPGPVWTSGKSRPHHDSIPDRPARSSVAIPTELPGPHNNNNNNKAISFILVTQMSMLGETSQTGLQSSGIVKLMHYTSSPGKKIHIITNRCSITQFSKRSRD